MTYAMTTGPEVKTPVQQEKERRDLALAREYRALMDEEPGRSRVLVKDYLKGKHKIHSDSGYYRILERGLNLLDNGAGAPLHSGETAHANREGGEV